MNKLAKIQDIALRLEQLESTGEWLARSLVHKDSSASQAGSMIMALADDIRDTIRELVDQIESGEEDLDSMDFQDPDEPMH